MFISLNKKILYSLLFFLLLLIAIFFAIFINLYSQQLEDTRHSVYLRNQYVVQLLNDNIRLQNELADMGKKFPEISGLISPQALGSNYDDTLKQLSHEQKLNAEFLKNYDNNRDAIITGAKIVGISLIIVIAFILLLFRLLNHWVLHPIDKLTALSRKVSQGDYSGRMNIEEQGVLQDEFDILNSTFNNMLDTTEKNIQDIQNREHFLQQLIDAIPDGIRVIDNNYNVLMANKAFYNLLKIKKSCVGSKCYLAYGNRNSCPQSKYNCPLKQLAEANDKYLRTIHEVGQTPLYVNAAKLSDDYVIESLHDLSNDIRFSHQQKVASLGFLSTSIAHEMKNNLGAVRMIMEGLLDNEMKDMPADEPQKKYLQMAYQQLVESVKMPERLLRLAQYSENETTEVNAATAVKDMMLMIDYDAKRHGINIMHNIDDQLKLLANEADFKMIILNLAQNAIKAMPDGGNLEISGERRGKFIQIVIKDSGVGIDAEKIKHIFEPFYSANNQSRSSGLGLAIVNSLMQKYGGKISVKSKIGEGSAFTLKFPAV